MNNYFYLTNFNLLPFLKTQVKFLLLLLFFSSTSYSAFAQDPPGLNCGTAGELCPMMGLDYPGTTNAGSAEPGNNYGCLATVPNPAWFYIEIEQAGNIDIALSNSASVDIDFALWGPFPNLPTAFSTCGSLGAPLDCSYSPSATESVNIPNSPAGQVYLLLITNFSNSATNINGVATGSGVASCDGACLAEGGTLNMPSLITCENNPSLNLPPSGAATNPDYSYTYVISQGGTVVAINPTPSLSGLGTGNFTVCGFSYLTAEGGMVNGFIGQLLSSLQSQFSGTMPPFCGDFSDDCTDVTVEMLVDPIFKDTVLCPGDCFMIAGMQVCNSTSFTVMNGGGCPQDYNISVINEGPFITPDFGTKCPNECFNYNGVDYCDAGTYEILYQSFNGCDSVILLDVSDIVTVAQIFPNPPPTLDCSNPSVILSASSSTPSSGPFEWNGPDGFISNEDDIVVTEPGTYILTVFNNEGMPPCEATDMVTIVQDAGAPEILVDEDPLICLGESENLADYVSDISGSGTITFHSSSPPTAGNQLPSSTVSPTTTTTYYILATNGGCTDEDEITVFVNDAPTADFTVDSPICLTDVSNINYTGTAGSNAIFNWDFGGGDATPGFGEGPHSVSFSSAGFYTISLTVEENGCESEEVTMDIEVVEPLDPPMVMCDFVTTTSVQFIWNDVPGATSYTVEVVTGQSGVLTNNTFLVDGLGGNEDVTIVVTAIGAGTCGDAVSIEVTCTTEDCPDVNLNFTPVDPICLDGMNSPFNLESNPTGGTGSGMGMWSGAAIIDADAGTVDPSSLMVGDNIFTYNYSEGDCDYSEMLTIVGLAVPTADFTATSPICETGTSTVNFTGTAATGATYTWDFDGGNATPGTGAGPHTVDWSAPGTYTVTLTVTQDGCSSEMESQTVEVQPALEPLSISCSSTVNSVTFTWNNVDGATGYNITDVTGPAGMSLNDTTYTVTGLNPGDLVTIMVEAISGGLCSNVVDTGDCTAEDCEPITVTIDPVMPICLDANAVPFDLVATTNDATPTGTITFSGSPAVNTTGTFDPSLGTAGTNMVTATYTEGACMYMASINIVLNAQPLADFTVDSPICENATSTITYTGTSGTGATYTWDFDGGNTTPGTGIGPHEVDWDTPGTYTVTLTVEQNGCTSTMESQTVQVDETLEPLMINCSSTINSVTFTWNDVDGATGYNITDVTGPAGMSVNDTTYTVTGLNPDDMVTIMVEAISGNSCPNVSQTADCTAENCDPITVTIDPVMPICLDANAVAFDLVATTDDATPTGTFTFSGSPAVNTMGNFDPSLGMVGANMVTATYTEGACTYMASINIDLIAQPSADFTVDSPICENATSTIIYTGTSGTGATYTWDFDGGNASPGTGIGPHEVDWNTPGTYTVTLTVEQNGCTSTEVSQMVQVDAELIAPLIDCEETINSVEFSWNQVTGATGYTVNVISTQTGTMNSDTSIIFENLGTEETVTIELVVEGNTVCGDITIPADCTTTDCLPADIEIVNPSPICLDANASPITLELNVTGITPGSITWEGSGIPNPDEPIFDPNMAGAGMSQVTVTIIDGDCTYTESILINVIAQPTADFTADSPICINETATVTYTGTAPAGSTFAWDFGGGIAMPGNGEGPHEVSWSTAGPQTISLIVTDNNLCASESNSVDVQVDDVLPNPVVNCTSTTTSVLFFWDEVLGATGYTVDVLTGETGMMTSDTSFEIINIPTGSTVEIVVTANGNSACGSSMTTAMCTALDCPTVIIDITEVDDICLGAVNVPQVLEVMVSGNPDCVGTWDGAGIIDPDNGTFDATVAGIGSHVITYTCTDGPCITTQTTTINVFGIPVADFTFTSPICEDDGSEIEFSGTASANATYIWDFDGGIAVPGGNSPGPHTVVWANADIHTVTLTVMANGCTSEMAANDIEVQSPLNLPIIDCNTTTESIEFIWNNVAGASGYNVTVVPTGGMSTSDTSYLVTGLNPLDEIMITVEVIDDGPCANVSATTTCTAVDCPDVIIDIEPIGPFCLNNFLEQQNLEVTVTGGMGNGTGTWSGPGITNPNNDIFDPIVAGVGNHQIVYTYTEDNCSYNESITIEIIAAPNADAGLAMTLTCDEPGNVAQLGGSGTSVGANIEYDWNTATGIPFPGDSTIATPIVTVPGVYTLVVTNTTLGCSASSTVSVDANQGIPQPNIVSSMASCFGDGNGSLLIDSVANGTPPYLYSFNGGTLSSTNFFPNLSAGQYDILVEDANGCTFAATVDVEQPEELNLELNTSLEGDTQIELGDSITITVIVNEPYSFEELDTVQWIPALAVDCDTCMSNTVMPTVPTTYTVMVQEGDCIASDAITIFVNKDLEIYVPNVFSPNGDGENEFVFPQAREGIVENINSFLIFNRWGESVYEIYNIPPNDINLGWGGTERGEPLDPQVFVWFAEVVFVDGTTKIFKGDVTLVK